jgi:SAM-dependent methyltransferase
LDELETWLERAYAAAGDRATLDGIYDEWAKDYDQHIWSSGNPYIAISAGMAGKYIDGYDAGILDVGCGTGNMAQLLYQMGFNNIEGLDPSEGMLALARHKDIYRKLHRLSLAAEVDLPEAGFDAVVAAGVLTHGHAPPEALDGILKLTKPGGVIIFTLSEIAFNEMGFGEKIEQLGADGAWRKLDQSRLFRSYPFSEQEAHIRHWVFAYQRI